MSERFENVQDFVQIVTNDFKTELQQENHWLLFAPIPVEHLHLMYFRNAYFLKIAAQMRSRCL